MAVGDCQARSGQGSSVNTVGRHGLNADYPLDLMLYPNRTHAISEGRGTTVHVYRLIARYFLQNLPAGAR
jgi:hypothetical protein